MGGQRLKLVGRRLERQAGNGGDMVGESLGETGPGVKAGADGGAALGKKIKLLEAALHPVDADLDLGRVA